MGHLQEFFERFRTLNVRSNDQLDDLVGQCQQVIGGVTPKDLRQAQPLRQRIATELSAVTSNLEGLLVDRPRRRVLRQPGKSKGAFASSYMALAATVF